MLYTLFGLVEFRILALVFGNDVSSYHWLFKLAYFVEHNEGYQPFKFRHQDKKPLKNISYELGTKFQIDFLKHFITFLKDVFMGLPYYKLNFSALTA